MGCVICLKMFDEFGGNKWFFGVWCVRSYGFDFWFVVRVSNIIKGKGVG